ncbi:MIF4G domain-containing protein [Colletotrichum graminicola]|uniref:MIF4G domain-containing protein n=1 Tax=Colletotrichum graminicola (strain M1.001 / M2 / FGSC 10212) TaxID=645133 RepID=E3QLT6_COLGM|nr:MIF4G domain-containing protein [Colletotrichum graminicola M1.001]EFQ31824.1 MIF4G domain-containing protein [Colletotrichum graminicola M1.001]WDK13593.1 MIF4G domain-containing protein [Colletotrichum graminicola]
MAPKPLAVPPQLLKEIGAPEQTGVLRSNRRWKSQGQNRRDRRKAERQSKKQRQATSRRDPSKQIHQHVERGQKEDIDEDSSNDGKKTPTQQRHEQFSHKKRKRADLGETNDSDELEQPAAAKHPSRKMQEKLAKDDAEIEQLERKLGMKKGRKSLPKSFKDDGLEDLLGDLNDASDWDEVGGKMKSEAEEWLAQKRQKATETLAKARRAPESEGDYEDEEDFSDELDFTRDDDSDSDGSNDDAMISEDDSHDQSSFEGIDSGEEETAQDTKRVKENPYLPPVAAGTQLPKYIPPSLRAKSGGDADVEAQIRRQLQGPVNRVAEANLTSIVGEIEKIYQNHPRGHTNKILTSLLMAQICDPTSKPDTLLVLSAGFIAALYKVIGVDFAAHFLTTSVERFQVEREKAIAMAAEQRIPTKETSNLLTVLAEMYIFRVISSNLMFDFVRILLGDLSELNAELLLRIVRVAGPQLRKDDPLALKDIVSLIRPAVANIGEGNLTVRTKFMIETISDLKNNKIKAGAQDLVILNEHVTRMRKVLGSLDTLKLKATEPLRIGLKDIENADRTGKWWLVGASWAGQSAQDARRGDNKIEVAAGPESSKSDDGDDDVVVADADDLATPDYAQLAREQGMNTDVRRAIFIALVAAADYQDAFMRILKLRLNKYNRREIPNVLLQCSGAQQHYNPYYTLVARKFCSDSRIKHAFQDTLWTLFRRLGEPLFGEEPEEEDEEAADDRRLINTAKMVGSLVADGSIGLGILKPLNLAYVRETTSLFVEVMLITVLQECSRVKNKSLEQALSLPLGSGLAPALARSLGYFLRKKVRVTDLVSNKRVTKTVREACRVAERLLERPGIDAV